MSHSTQIKRNQKAELSSSSSNSVVTRDRSFVKIPHNNINNKDPSGQNNNNKHKGQSLTSAIVKGSRPAMEIYRPPNIRSDSMVSATTPAPSPNSGKLNVHAKEFTMNHQPHQHNHHHHHHHHHHQQQQQQPTSGQYNHHLQPSKSSVHVPMNFESLPLQHSKSSGNILKHRYNRSFPLPIIDVPPLHLPLIHSTSQILNHSPRINYHHDIGLSQHLQQQQHHHHPIFSGHNFNTNSQQYNNNYSLKRSKSLGATDAESLTEKLKGITKEELDLDSFPIGDQTNIKLALEDPNQLSSRTMMDLVKVILERVVEGIKYSEAGAKLCVSIIEKEKNQTFMESLLNSCQQWYQERDKILRGVKAGDGTRFTAFMWFLTEMCAQLKRQQLLREQYESLNPDLVLLSILAKCCQSCVSLPIKCLSETECLFFVLTSIGRDLESELPQQLEQLLANVRDAFLANAGSPPIRRTLLQLIELHASNWQLPGSSVLYYYPRRK